MGFKSDEKSNPAENGHYTTNHNNGSDDSEPSQPPPAYTPHAEQTHLDDAFAKLDINLSIPDTPGKPEVDTCLAHLKLLHAIQDMKEDVGYTDGLWNIWDSRADYESPQSLDAISESCGRTPSGGEARRVVASEIREKRWALFVARAVDRYAAWWNSFQKRMLTEVDMQVVDSTAQEFGAFPKGVKPLVWDEAMMLPLDVLMVFHTHMLNPRAFLEDTLRNGFESIWSAGMPWKLVNAAIGADWSYNVSEDAKANWVARTGCNWDNTDDSLTKSLTCPYCSTKFAVPWTTCGMDQEFNSHTLPPGLTGTGYGDGNFTSNCSSCGREIYKKLLSVVKFSEDTGLLIHDSVPMPGTVLDPVNGSPSAVTSRSMRMFPNYMIQRDIGEWTAELLWPEVHEHPTMKTVRDTIQRFLRDSRRVRDVVDPIGRRSGRVMPPAKLSIRKMMSRYWENFSPFALDLCSAVMRQGVFIDKMCNIDWLHSPSARETMARLITKYERFVDLMAANPNNVCVPTLDVDLAWHTHQLSPLDYYNYTKHKTAKFIDHDDKIDEDKLGEAFEWTTKEYQRRFNEVYSECTCWYCEATRSSNMSSVGVALGMSNQERLQDSLHNSASTNLHPPDSSAHISSHNAVKTEYTKDQSRLKRHLRMRHRDKLERNYQKALKRADKKGHKLPPRNQYYDHWGYQYYMYSPYMHPVYFTPGMYYGWDPNTINNGHGAWANCAAGSCGAGDVAAGGCGGPGGCGGSGGCGSIGSCGGGGGIGGSCGGGGCGGGGGGCGGGGGGC